MSRVGRMFLAGSLLLVLTTCASSGTGTGVPVLGVPFLLADQSKIRVDNVFVASDYANMAGTPFGNAHLGIHYSPVTSHNADLSYYAMAAGTIESIQEIVSSGKYNVNVIQDAGGGVSIVYQFETESSDPAAGTAQRAKIAVSVGQSVAEGDRIGDLHDAGAPNPLLHIGVIQGSDLICPVDLMSASSVTLTEALLENASWQTCYVN